MKDIITIPKPSGEFNIFVVSLDGMFISTNEGINWSTINSGLNYRNINSLAASATNIFAGSCGGGVYLSTNNGSNWTTINTGLTNLFIQKLFIDGSYIYAGTVNGIVWRRELSQVITSLNDEDEIVNQFVFEQNYPNPFNPNTAIEYSLFENSFVILKVYDMLGSEVALLINEEKAAGKYRVDFDASKLSTGVYIYKLTAGSFSSTKKMLVTK
jgi:ligand-binding sensor domain-containing protein